MADEDEFSFDLNCNLDDIQLDESELAEFGLLGSAGSGDAALQSIQSMADSSKNSPAVQGNFGFIRALDNGAEDYNVDNVILTAEDMEDPALLAELGQLNSSEIGSSHVQVVEEEGELPLELKLECEDRNTLEKYIAEEKKMALTCKRAGDMEGAATSLKGMKALQARLAELETEAPVVEVPVESKPSAPTTNNDVAMLKAQALEAKRMGDITLARELLTQAKQLESGNGPASPIAAHAPSPASKAKAKETMTKLTQQIEQCLEAAKVYLKRGSQADAGLLVNRKKAFEADLMAIKAAVLGNKAIPDGRTVTAELPIDLENVEVGEDELKAIVSSLEPSNANQRKSKDNLALFTSKSDHFIQVTFAYPAEDPSEKSSPTFKISAFPGERFSFTGLKRDVKLAKFFEHQKVRIDLFKKESSLFRSKNVLIGSVHAKLCGLMTAPSLELKALELVDGARRSVGMQIDLVLKLRRPISNRIAATKSVQWIVFDEAPLTSGRLFSDPNKPIIVSNIVSSPPPATTKDEEASDVAEIESYAVVEHELGLLATNPATLTDPSLSTRQLELESKKDSMDLAFQMGQVSFEDYLETIKAYAEKSKKRALEAKRGGALERARYYMKHVQIVEKEIADASTAGDDDEE